MEKKKKIEKKMEIEEKKMDMEKKMRNKEKIEKEVGTNGRKIENGTNEVNDNILKELIENK